MNRHCARAMVLESARKPNTALSCTTRATSAIWASAPTRLSVMAITVAPAWLASECTGEIRLVRVLPDWHGPSLAIHAVWSSGKLRGKAISDVYEMAVGDAAAFFTDAAAQCLGLAVAKAAPVIGDGVEAGFGHGFHLAVPHAVVADPGMEENDGKALARLAAGEDGAIQLDCEIFHHGESG